MEHKIPPTATVVMNWVKASASRENGDFCAEVRRWSNGTVEIRNSKTPDIPALAFTAEEWSAFESGVRAGEFSEGRS